MRRRDFLAAGTSAAVLLAVPRPLMAYLGPRPEPVPPIQDPRLKSLAFAAVEAAKAAGASYADVRLTHSRQGLMNMSEEWLSIGVRALVQGYWGFAASALWAPDEAARLGREAVLQAKANVRGRPRLVELAPVPPVVPDGHWETPITVNPLTVSWREMDDYLGSLRHFVRASRPGRDLSAVYVVYEFEQQEKAFASSEGSYCTQRLCESEAFFSVSVRSGGGIGGSEFVFPWGRRAGVGWEYIRDREAEIRAAVPRLLAEAEAEARIPLKSEFDVGRYDAVFSARAIAALLTPTIGAATELDRALGYEANAGGTSYLTDPAGMVGNFGMGAPLLTVTGNRSARHGLATVKWDDEGVEPDEVTLVKEGVLNDFLTNREGAGWLKDAYTERGQPFRSHGCAAAPQALDVPLIRVPNLVMTPGEEDLDFDDLVAGIEKGVAFRSTGFRMDFQMRTGTGRGQLFEVQNGKRVARIIGGFGCLFRVPELWKSLSAVGGPGSARWFNAPPAPGIANAQGKGEPARITRHSVSAVPAAVEQLTILDLMRKA